MAAQPGDGVSKQALVHRLLDEWNAGNRTAIEEHLHPEVKILTLRSKLEARPYRGVEGFRRGIADFDQDWEYVRMDVEDVRSQEDHVVILGKLQARGRASGVELDVPFAMLWSFEGERISEIRSFSEADDALRAAGFGA
jgi:ketosteroid isomerase-like protein